MKTHHIVLIGAGVVGVIALIKFWPKAKPTTGSTGKSGTDTSSDPLQGRPAHTSFTGPQNFANASGRNFGGATLVVTPKRGAPVGVGANGKTIYQHGPNKDGEMWCTDTKESGGLLVACPNGNTN